MNDYFDLGCIFQVGASFSYSGLFSASASFSLDHSYKEEKRDLKSSNKAYVDIKGKAVVYKARLANPMNVKVQLVLN